MQFGSLTFTRVRRLAPRALPSLAWLALLAAGSGASADPLSYFSTAEGLSGASLKSRLSQLINANARDLSYTPGVWDAHKDLYEDPDNPNNVILFYSELSYAKSATGANGISVWNREHLWPNSYGIDDDRPAYTDLFHLVPTIAEVNARRSNKYFDYTNPADGGHTNPGHYLAPETSADFNSWEPGDRQKGWAARAVLYMDTRYSHLTLVDTPPSPTSTGNIMAQLSVMLEWNRRFPPTAKERAVNQRIFTTWQFNRNPYIDFPEFADAVWIDGPSWGGWRVRHFSLAELLDPAISGDAADPDGDGLPNRIELARYSDPRSAAQAPAIGVARHSASEIALSFVRASDPTHLGVALVLESSLDLQQWDPVDLAGADVDPLNPEQESLTLVLPMSATEPVFYRLSTADN